MIKLKNQILTSLKNLDCEKTQKINLQQNSKIQIVTKPKLWKPKNLFSKNNFFQKKKKKYQIFFFFNLNKTEKIYLWENKTYKIVIKLKKSNCDNNQKLKLWENSKLKLWQNFKTQIATKFQNSNGDKTKKKSNYDKTHIATKLKNSNSNTTQKLK